MDNTIKKLPANTIWDKMNRCNERNEQRLAVIVFSQSNWPNQTYTERQRSYKTWALQ